MLLMELFARWRMQSDKIEELAEQLAAACAAEVRSRLSERVFQMSHHESRGYVRARAAAVVSRVTAVVSHRERIPARSVPQLNALALDATTRIVHRQVATRQSGLRVRRAG